MQKPRDPQTTETSAIESAAVEIWSRDIAADGDEWSELGVSVRAHYIEAARAAIRAYKECMSDV